ncbi:MAG: nitroreductase [Promethearchaeota archaeon CR_4]|nr:MAG: nitroreductase [Candidatus Lokiarchaeota archaeon CR_4]
MINEKSKTKVKEKTRKNANINATLKIINSLRSIHGNFSPKDISESHLLQIIDASIKTANSSARQCYSIIVIDDREQMQELIGYQGSRALIYCVDFNRLRALAKHLGHEFSNEDIIGFITGTMDAMLAAQTAVIAAKSLGIDSLITNGMHRTNFTKVYELLHLPETSCFPLITIVLGYPKAEPPHKKGRLSREFVVHFGKYTPPDTTTLEGIVAEYDDNQKRIGLIDNWEQEGFRHYLDWFYVKWMGNPPATKVPEGKILEFQEQLKKSGFWW